MCTYAFFIILQESLAAGSSLISPSSTSGRFHFTFAMSPEARGATSAAQEDQWRPRSNTSPSAVALTQHNHAEMISGTDTRLPKCNSGSELETGGDSNKQSSEPRQSLYDKPPKAHSSPLKDM